MTGCEPRIHRVVLGQTRPTAIRKFRLVSSDLVKANIGKSRACRSNHRKHLTPILSRSRFPHEMYASWGQARWLATGLASVRAEESVQARSVSRRPSILGGGAFYLRQG
jgi:hypothetical protein